MRYNPDDAEDALDMEPGLYNFIVIKAEETQSRNRNEQIVLVLDVNGTTVYDYLVNTPKGLWKVKMFCKEVGLPFEVGQLQAADCMGKTGRAELHYTEKDLNDVAQGNRQRAYLKVKRYGVHGEPPSSGQARSTRDELPLCPECGNFRCTCDPPPDENKWGKDCPF